ncbi:AraC family transcriptional regulator [Nesterenkonia sp. NBAIMH1]|uniref:helix-turn-helix transcriptional regulator n=1 Tax=Nesterenkonia sp. NBAIMH1 TaxID=2600320 RepID=UPI0011B753DA|nr:AraC family transcriptional regulator [Nesterenkonia sp. NBAIMH1]
MSVEVRRVEQQTPDQIGFRIGGMGEELLRSVEWQAHAHPFHELLWNPRGASTIAVGSRLWTVAGADGLWIPAGTEHSGWAGAGTLYRAVLLSPEAVEAMPEDVAAVTMTPLLTSLLDHIDAQDLTDEQRSRAQAVVPDLIRPSGAQVSLRLPARDPARTAARAVLEDVRSAPSAQEWAERLGISRRTLTRSFQTETGVGYARWTAEARVHRARELLSGGFSVADTAEDVGFSSASAFISAFKRVTGATPGLSARPQDRPT